MPSCAAAGKPSFAPRRGVPRAVVFLHPPMEYRVHATDHYVVYSPATAFLAQPPIVIHIPGFNGDALSDAPFALRMAKMGWQCYIVEPPWSATPDLQNPNPSILFQMFEQLEPSFQALLQHLRPDAWVAVTGFSMGGMFVSQMLVHPSSHAIAAAALILSSGDWSFLPRTAVNAIPELRAAVDETALGQIEAHFRTISPVAQAERFPPTPLLLLNAENDPRVPIENAQAFYEELRPAYNAAGAADHLEWQRLPGNRHEFRRHMQMNVRDWLHAQYLARPATA